MRNAFIILSFLILVAVNASMACSVYVDNNAQKVILTDLAASYLDLNLATVSATTVSGYSKLFSDENPETLCPETLSTEATITFTYHPSKKEDCQAKVTVLRSTYIGEDPTISFETVSVVDSSAMCAIAYSAMRLPRPVRPMRKPPVRPVRPVRP
ncbi:MAG: hypothetical protein H0V66_10825 [Bdellovibrionales bacterium]|nr:hypothetical protein [Bdellovibrionales bacterium]